MYYLAVVIYLLLARHNKMVAGIKIHLNIMSRRENRQKLVDDRTICWRS